MTTDANERGWRWAPIRRGDTYCSPACGRRCTFAAYELAVKRGKALARKLGPGWTHHVWENGGWHYQAQLTTDSPIRVEVHADRYAAGPVRYTAFVHNTFVESDTNPRKALRAALKRAWDEHRAIGEMLIAVRDATAGTSKLTPVIRLLKESL